jgi:hypothetical protein
VLSVNPKINNNEKINSKCLRGIVLNSKFNNGLCISPQTIIDDGKTELCLFGDIGKLDEKIDLLLQNKIKNFDHLNNKQTNLGNFFFKF